MWRREFRVVLRVVSEHKPLRVFDALPCAAWLASADTKAERGSSKCAPDSGPGRLSLSVFVKATMCKAPFNLFARAIVDRTALDGVAVGDGLEEVSVGQGEGAFTGFLLQSV